MSKIVAGSVALLPLLVLGSACDDGRCQSLADCPIGQLCSAAGVCIDEPPPSGEGEGEASEGEGEGEGEGGEGEGEGTPITCLDSSGPLDPGAVYFSGQLSPSGVTGDVGCGLPAALASVDDPFRLIVGFDSCVHTYQGPGPDGRLLYSDGTFLDVIKAREPDELGPGCTYPSSPEANDEVIVDKAVDCPPGTNDMGFRFDIFPDTGDVLHACELFATELRSTNGDTYAIGDAEILHAGFGGRILLVDAGGTGLTILDAAGASTPTQFPQPAGLLLPTTIIAVRALDDGFAIAHVDGVEDTELALLDHIDFAGAVTPLGHYLAGPGLRRQESRDQLTDELALVSEGRNDDNEALLMRAALNEAPTVLVTFEVLQDSVWNLSIEYTLYTGG